MRFSNAFGVAARPNVGLTSLAISAALSGSSLRLRASWMACSAMEGFHLAVEPAGHIMHDFFTLHIMQQQMVGTSVPEQLFVPAADLGKQGLDLIGGRQHIIRRCDEQHWHFQTMG